MPENHTTSDWEPILRFFLRLWGCLSLTALVFVFVPYQEMNAIHNWLGMGPLPDAPVVGYLARSTSAFYALIGGLFWVVSFDIKRHRLVIGYLAGALTLFGVLLLGIDWLEGMPTFWKYWEGPFVLMLGLVTFFLNHRIGSMTNQNG